MEMRCAWALGILMLLPLPVNAAVEAEIPLGVQGYLYGTVETTSGKSYGGLLRWGTEEAFWDDLFNSSKVEMPYLKEYAKDEKRERNRVTIFGVTIGYRWNSVDATRLFIARFGDIAEIKPGRGGKAEVVMRDGTVYEINGASNDVDSTIVVLDRGLGPVELSWDRIRRIEFHAAPSTAEPRGHRLHGTVETEQGRFEGYVQWDLQECLSLDKLDGETDDGDLSIEMGLIRSIAKRNRRASTVELKDGRSVVLEGTNDVDSSMRGIFVEDARYGRVEIPWSAFRKVSFDDVESSGRGYGEYAAAEKLRGGVTDREGRLHRGVLVFDLDESETWEMLNGKDAEDVEYYVPFSRIRSIEPQGEDTSRIVLTDGTTLKLGHSQDVGSDNDGVVVIGEGDGTKLYLPWDEVQRIDLD